MNDILFAQFINFLEIYNKTCANISEREFEYIKFKV